MEKQGYFMPIKSQSATIRARFTLTELLIAIAIIAILAAMLLATLNQARMRARAISCVNNLKQVGTVAATYALNYDDFILPCGFWHMGREQSYYWNVYCFRNNQLPPRSMACPERPCNPANTYLQKLYNSSVSIDDNIGTPNSSWARFGYGINKNAGGVISSNDIPVKLSRIPSVSRKIYAGDTYQTGTLDPSVSMRSSTPSMTWDGSLTPIHITSCNLLFIDGHATAIPGRTPEKIYAHPLVAVTNAADDPWILR